MSPIFRHGRLRLYLLKLLDEAPRHGYEVIRLLQDRFMGVYSPSPGTIYPRLARLEEDGLVTHDEVDGRKVYRITEKGREEIRARLDDLAELEEELTESVRDIAREVTEDVRDTVRSLREEITWAARDIRREGRGRPGRPPSGPDEDRPGDQDDGAAPDDAADDRAGGRAAGGRTADGRAAGGRAADGGASDGAAGDAGSRADADDAERIRDEARQTRDDIRDSFKSQRRGGRQDWGGWADRAAGWQAWGNRKDDGDQKSGERPGWAGWQDLGDLPAGLERLASDFARELRTAAGHAGDIGEGALGDLRNILSDTLARIRDEVFDDDPAPTDPTTTGPDATGPDTAAPDTTAPDTTAPDTTAPDTAAPDATDPAQHKGDKQAPDSTP